MLWDTVKIITEIVERYGSESDLLLVTNQSNNTVIDFVSAEGSAFLKAHSVDLAVPPLQHISKDYRVLSADDGEKSALFRLTTSTSDLNGPVILDSVLESEPEPFETVKALAQKLSKDAYLVLISTFSSPKTDSADDRWRFTPVGLSQILSNANLYILESGWRLKLHGSQSVLDQPTNKPYELYTAYAVAAPRELQASTKRSFSLPSLQQTAQALVTKQRSSEKQAPSNNRTHRCVFINTCYDAFLRHHYSQNPHLLSAPYQEQLEALNQTFFGDSDFYSRGLKGRGFEATDLVVNCAPLQRAWARENNIPGDGYELVKRQLDVLKPDVVYVQDMAGTPREILAHAKSQGSLIAGQIACELASSVPLDIYDLIFSSFPHYVDSFRAAGITSYYQPLAFEPRILATIGNRDFDNRDIACSFVGGISPYHQKGSNLLEKLATETPIEIWGYGIEGIPTSSAVSRRHRGEAWGREMFTLLNRSKITINRHSEAASTNANNMRLFEATGAGALLITDYKDNLSQLFEIGKEVVAYRTPEECVALARYYHANPNEAREIAEAGQRRTLSEHSYQARMNKTAEILARHIEYRSLNLPAPNLTGVSTQFKPLSHRPADNYLTEGWKGESVAVSQRGLVQQELASMFRGAVPTPFHVAAQLLSPVIKRGSTLLEIGCSSGYYYEALEYILKKPLRYTGCDYSKAMINMAHSFYPDATFAVADGAALPFADRSFECVLSGCVLLHCTNYLQHIKETCRVARDHILLHRTPISTDGKTRFFEKAAYGAPTVEIWFSEAEILGLFADHGFRCVERFEYNNDPSEKLANISYLLKAGARV